MEFAIRPVKDPYVLKDGSYVELMKSGNRFDGVLNLL